MAAGAVPERLVWAVRMLDVGPADHLLEIGCGRGVAVSLICDRLVTGKIVALDRSPVMIDAATRRNAKHINAGKAVFHLAALADARLEGERFDKIFAINVNLFWVRRAMEELTLIGRLLRPDGALYLFYEPPDRGRLDELAGRVTEALAGNGFSTSTVAASAPRSSLLGIVARPRLASDGA